MASTSLGINIAVKGAGKATKELAGVATATRSIGVAGVAIGSLLGGALLKAGKMAVRYASNALKGATELAKSVREGAAIPDGISAKGLAAAEAISAAFKSAGEFIFGAFVNALPYVLFFGKAAVSVFNFIKGVVVDVFGPGFVQSISESFATIGENFKIFGAWLFENWKDVAHNVVTFWFAAWKWQIGNTVALFKSFLGFIKGQGWNFNGVAFDTSGLRDIGGPQFKELPIAERIAAAIDANWPTLESGLLSNLQEVRGLALKQGSAAPQKAVENKLAEAITRGSLADVSTLNKLRAGFSNDAIQKAQLAEQRKQTKSLNTIAAAFAPQAEYNIA